MGLILADTNIFLYIIKGLPQVDKYIDVQFALSEISEIELLGVKGITDKEALLRKQMIEDSFLLRLNDSIKQVAIQLKQKYRLKIPDTIIAATSIYHGMPLLSADRDFNKIIELQFIFLSI